MPKCNIITVQSVLSRELAEQQLYVVLYDEILDAENSPKHTLHQGTTITTSRYRL